MRCFFFFWNPLAGCAYRSKIGVQQLNAVTVFNIADYYVCARMPCTTTPAWTGYAATAVRNIVFTGNKVLGSGTGADFGCSVNDACENITVTNNTVVHNDDPWRCQYIKTYTSGMPAMPPVASTATLPRSLLPAPRMLTVYTVCNIGCCLLAHAAAGNTGETSLEACMKNSMHPKVPAAVRVSYEQRKQAAIQAWAESRR